MLETVSDPKWFLVLFLTGLIGVWLLAMLLVWLTENIGAPNRTQPYPVAFEGHREVNRFNASHVLECQAHVGGRIVIDRATGNLLQQCPECSGRAA